VPTKKPKKRVKTAYTEAMRKLAVDCYRGKYKDRMEEYKTDRKKIMEKHGMNETKNPLD